MLRSGLQIPCADQGKLALVVGGISSVEVPRQRSQCPASLSALVDGVCGGPALPLLNTMRSLLGLGPEPSVGRHSQVAHALACKRGY